MLKLFFAAVCILLHSSSAQELQLSFAVTSDSSESSCQHPCQANGTCEGKVIHDTCYFTFPRKTTWEENSQLCYSQNMSMVNQPVESFHEEFSLQDLVEDNGKDLYLWQGGRLEQLDEWKYVNGVPLEETHSNKLATFPDPDSEHQCGVICYTKTSKEVGVLGVNKLDCYQERHFICRFVDWKNSPSFYVSETAANWYEARSRCNFLGGDLFYLKKWENINNIKDKLGQAINKTLFIGLTDWIWMWEDGREFRLGNWKDGGPGKGDCLMMDMALGSWKRRNCSRKLHTVCQANKTEGHSPTGNSTMEKRLMTIIILANLFGLAVLVIVGQTTYIILWHRMAKLSVSTPAKCPKISCFKSDKGQQKSAVPENLDDSGEILYAEVRKVCRLPESELEMANIGQGF